MLMTLSDIMMMMMMVTTKYLPENEVLSRTWRASQLHCRSPDDGVMMMMMMMMIIMITMVQIVLKIPARSL